MVNWGSTLRLKLTDASGTKVFYEHYFVLSKWNMKAVLDNAFNDFAQAARAEVNTITAGLENSERLNSIKITDDELLALARQRGLVVHLDAPALFYYSSYSGKTKGHYIEKYANGLTCSCPGFQNRGTCWATKDMRSGYGNTAKWLASRDKFYKNRITDYPQHTQIYSPVA